MADIVGRYAPSPTGPLHLGNLRTALIAWLHSRTQNGQFLMRIEDLDLPRVIVGSVEQNLSDLKWLGLDWDGPLVRQSERNHIYQTALQRLQDHGLIYPCFCSRKELREAASAPHDHTPIYPGFCASLHNDDITPRKKSKTPSLRVRVQDTQINFKDGVLGTLTQNLAVDAGDFIVKRADGLFAYQLAVIVDDLAQGITHVIRGADLASSTFRQRYLANQLSPSSPPIEYWHVPLVVDKHGERMAKRFGSESAKDWRERGKTANQLVGKFAYDLGLVSLPRAISARELLAEINLQTLQSALAA